MMANTIQENNTAATWEQGVWAILELLGHRKTAGYCQIEALGGQSFLRVDIHSGEDVIATQYYSLGSIYCITPCSEEIAKQYAIGNSAPIQPWELPSEPSELPPSKGMLSPDELEELDELPL